MKGATAYTDRRSARMLSSLAAMLRIPVAMSNVPAEQVFRPHAWGLFGVDDPIGSDYRACRNFGPLYG